MIFMLKLNMGWNYLSSMIFFFFLFMGLSVSSTFISDDIFETHAFTGRNLLQAKKACPVNFEFMNYTIITSQCKGPKYPPDKCCPAFKQFACPYAEEISDLSTDCASTMFSYINIYGKYPAGIFASECQEGKEGLSCPQSPLSKSEDAKASQTSHTTSPLIMLTTGFLGLLLMLL